MNNLEILGLEENKVNAVRKGLAQLLADFQIFYTNLRNLHWNVKGRKLIDLANDAHDDVTADLMTGYIKGQEKTVWMLLAFVQHHGKNGSCCENK